MPRPVTVKSAQQFKSMLPLKPLPLAGNATGPLRGSVSSRIARLSMAKFMQKFDNQGMVKYLAILILTFSGSVIADSYLCLADQATAIFYNDKAKKWGRGIVTLEDNNYLLTPVDPETCGADCDYKYEVKKFGRSTLMAACYEEFDENGFLDCYTKGGKFHFNKVNGRYLWVHHLGYYNVLPEYRPTPGTSSPFPKSDEKSDPPYLEVGKCSPL